MPLEGRLDLHLHALASKSQSKSKSPMPVKLLSFLLPLTLLTATQAENTTTTPNVKKFEQHKRPSTDPLVKALLKASYKGDLTKVSEIMFGHGVNTEVHDERGWTPLNLASLAGHLSVVHFLVGVGANLEAKDISGQTPLGSASINGHLEVVKYLLSIVPPADVSAMDEHGARPLHYASQYGFALICNALLHAGADVNSEAHLNGWTPLHAACAAGRIDTVKLLLDWNARTDLIDHDGNTVLDVIGSTRPITRRATMIIQCLLDANGVNKDLCESVHTDHVPMTETAEPPQENG